MAERTSYEPGTPSWVDIGTTDVAAAAEFYSALFGWTVAVAPEPDAGGYAMAHLRERPVAGLGPAQDPSMPPSWTMYVTVADADSSAARARAAGAMVFAEIVNEHGALVWNELHVPDLDAAQQFYGDVFGWVGEPAGEGYGIDVVCFAHLADPQGGVFGIVTM